MAPEPEHVRARPDLAEPPLRPDPPGTGEADPEAPLYSGVELEDEDGERWVPRQQAVGRDAAMGSGEFADPATPPTAAAPGSVVEDRGSAQREQGSR
jgi:hypothetical protein